MPLLLIDQYCLLCTNIVNVSKFIPDKAEDGCQCWSTNWYLAWTMAATGAAASPFIIRWIKSWSVLLFCSIYRYLTVDSQWSITRLLSLDLFINKYCTFFIGIKYQHLPARCCPWYCCWWDQNVSWLILWIRIHYVYLITILIFLTRWEILFTLKVKKFIEAKIIYVIPVLK